MQLAAKLRCGACLVCRCVTHGDIGVWTGGTFGDAERREIAGGPRSIYILTVKVNFPIFFSCLIFLSFHDCLLGFVVRHRRSCLPVLGLSSSIDDGVAPRPLTINDSTPPRLIQNTYQASFVLQGCGLVQFSSPPPAIPSKGRASKVQSRVPNRIIAGPKIPWIF